jgi:hypothetical protein
MKAMKRIFFGSLLITGLFSCDKVENPIQTGGAGNNDTTSAPLIRKVLLEDYTGHQCGNCPAAALVAENLYSQYKGKVITLAVHAGFFARTNATYNTSYTTTVGNEWDGSSGFNVSAAGNPNGLVNRKDFGGGMIQKETKWSASVATALTDPYILSLELTKNYNESNRLLNLTVKSTFKNTYPNPTKLSVVLAEDSIIGDQKDYSKTPDHVPNYVFMHMLRASLNGSWGDDVKTSEAQANESFTKTFSNYNVNSAFNDKHIYIIAFVYDATSKEVLQVEKIKLR